MTTQQLAPLPCAADDRPFHLARPAVSQANQSRGDALHWLPGRTFACSWCRQHGEIPGSLLFYTYHQSADGWQAVASDPEDYSGSDGICPAHLAAVRAGWSSAKPAVIRSITKDPQ